MNPNTLTIHNVRLNEAGQRAQLFAGGCARARQHITVPHDDPAYGDLVAIAHIDPDGDAAIDASGLQPWDHMPSPTELLDALRLHRQQEREQQARRREQRRQETRAVLAARETRTRPRRVGDQWVELAEPAWPNDPDDGVVQSPEAQTWAQELTAQNLERVTAAEADECARAHERARREEERAELERRQHEARRELVRTAGTPDQLERFDAGLLPLSELRALIEGHVFAPLNSFTALTPPDEADVEHCQECSGPRIVFSDGVATELPAGPWAVMKEIRAIMPTARCEPRVHWGECSTCGARAVVYGIRVSVEWNGVVVERDYCGEPLPNKL